MAEQRANTMTINRIPAPTYRWLAMNEIQTESFRGVEAAADMDVPNGISVGEAAYAAENIATGMGREYDTLFTAIDGIRQKRFTIPRGSLVTEPVRLGYSVGDADALAPVFMELKEGARCTVVLRVDAENGAMARLASQVRARIGKDAKLTIVEVVTAADKEIFCDIGVETAENASFRLIQLFLAGRQIFSGCRCEMTGDRSSMQADIAYQVIGDDRLDMNYIANHIGKKTTSQMNVSGVLRDRAKKLFRGTIDFKRGAKGAVGNEQEDVLLIDDNVVNQTIPLILCAEEDVEGNHGATIGKLAEDLLFYLRSRGMDTAEIYEMMARARIDAVADKIADGQMREHIRRFLGEETDRSTEE